MTWPVVVGWIVIAVGFVIPGPFLLYAFFTFAAFGTLDLIPHEAVGGLNMSGQAFCALFLIVKIFMNRDNARQAVEAALDPGRFGLLSLFLIYGIFTAFLLPRLFEGMADIIPMNNKDIEAPVPLMPTVSNMTQSAYMTVSVAAALAFAVAGQNETFRRHFLLAALFGGTVLVVTGLVDMAAASLGIGDLLAPFRTMSGHLLVDDYVLDTKRVVGLMAEASAFGGTCTDAAVALSLLRPCFPRLLRNWVVPPVVLGLVVMAGLSTSSTAYAGLAAFAATFALNWFRRALDPQALNADGLILELSAVVAALFAVLVVICVAPSLLDPVYAMINEQIFNKGHSGSYVERTMWTRTGLDAFFATSGIGVGLGSARTSNWFVAVPSNTGVVGAALFACFVAQLLLYRLPRDKHSAEFVTALRFSLLPEAVMCALAGTAPDFGVYIGALFGLIVALAAPRPQPRSQLLRRPALETALTR